jgi:glycosyltransferase involved in cell wall biosynthesis
MAIKLRLKLRLWSLGHGLRPRARVVEGSYVVGEFCPGERFENAGSPFSPRVTVIVPNYNHDRFLKERLDSIYEQSYKNVRVILLDDGSTDASQAVLASYRQHHPDITELHVNAVNGGSAFRQWSKGLALAEGELIWIAESDDYCDRDFLQTLVPFFRDEAVKVAYSRTVFVGSQGQPLSVSFEDYVDELSHHKWRSNYVETAHEEVIQALGRKNSIPNVSGVVFRKPTKGGRPPEEEWAGLKLCGDWIFYLYLVRGGKIAFSKDTRNYHRYHTSNLAVSTYESDVYYREHALVAGTVARLYRVPEGVLESQAEITRRFWHEYVGPGQGKEFSQVYPREPIRAAVRQRRPNILMVGYAFATGGGEIFPIRLAAALRDRGYGVTYYDFQGDPVNPRVREMLPADIPVVEHRHAVGALDRLLEKFGIEIVHSHNARADFYCAVGMSRMRGRVRHVVTTHGMYEAQEESASDRMLPVVMKTVDAWVYLTEKNLVPFKERGLYRADRFVRVANGISPVAVTPIGRESLGIAPEAFVMCLASRAVAEKGWLEAIQSTTEAREASARDIHLVLLGDGALHEALSARALPPYIHALGFKPNPADYYAMADVGLLPSRFKGESFPLAVIECLMAGRPVIASDVGEIRSMLTAEEGDMAGAVFSLRDGEVPTGALAQIIAQWAGDGEGYTRARNVARRLASRFSMEHTLEGYAAVYEECLARIPAQASW